MSAGSRTYKPMLWLCGLFALVITIIAFIHPPALYPDPSWGFQVLRGMRLGGGFNMLPAVDLADIGKNSPFFLTWWSPGQYLAPGVFISLLKVNIGQATVLVSGLCSLLGLGGLYRLFVKLGFSKQITAISLLFIVTQEFFFIPYVFYNGGEILLFGFTPWFLYGCIRIERVGWEMVVFVLLSGVIGFFCKSAFIWMYAAGLLLLWIRLSSLSKSSGRWLQNAIWLAVPALAALAVIYLGYLSKGDNPAGGSGGLKLAWETFSFPLAAPLLAGFSVDEMCNGLLYRVDTPIFNPFWTMIVLIVAAVVSMFLVARLIKKIPNTNYRLLLLCFYGVCVAFFGISFLRQAEISYEARHMRVIGLIVIPGTVQLVVNSRQAYRWAFGAIWLVIFWHGGRFLLQGYQRNTTQASHGDTGVAQLFADQPTLDYLRNADRKETDAIFVFNSPDLGLEITHNRIITLDPLFEIPSPLPENFLHKGHAGPVYFLMPAYYKGQRAGLLMGSFPEYHRPQLVHSTKNFMIYRAE